MVEVVLLGSGSAVPTAKRNHIGIFMKYGAEAMLFDCGEGIQRQFRKAKINMSKLTRIFITHWHGDHVLGIPGLLQSLHFNGYSRKLKIYGPVGTKRYLEKMLDLFDSIGGLDIEINEVSGGKVVDKKNFEVVAREVKHGSKCLAYSFVEKDRLRLDKRKVKGLPHSPKLALLQQGKNVVIEGKKLKAKDVTYEVKGKKVSIVLDTAYFKELASFVKGSDLLIIESTYFDEEDLAKEYKHMTVGEAVGIAKSAKVGKAVLVHISQKHAANEKEILKSAKAKFKNVVLGNDLDKFEV